jgi:cytochrome P450
MAPGALPLIGHAKKLGVDFFGGLKELCIDVADENGLACFNIATAPTISVINSKDIKKVLLNSNHRTAIPLLQLHFDAFLGRKALVTLMGAEWKHHRLVTSKAFHWENLKAMAAQMGNVATQLADQLSKHDGKVLDLWPIMKMATLDTFGVCALSYDFGCVKALQSSPIADAFEFMLDELSRRIYRDTLLPTSIFYSLPTEANLQHRKHSALLRKLIAGLITQRHAERAATAAAAAACRTISVNDPPASSDAAGAGAAAAQGGAKKGDLLTHLLDAADETEAEEGRGLGGSHKKMDDESVRDLLFTLLFGGYDTTSITMSYTLYMLSQQQEIEKKVYEEVVAVLGEAEGSSAGAAGDTARGISYEQIQKLTYCAAVVQETLRLYPPAPLTVRSLESDLELGGHLIPVNTMVYLPIWWIHRYTVGQHTNTK